MGLLNSTVAGNLESVLDEQLFAWRRIGSLKEDTAEEALGELEKALSLPAGSLSLHRGGRKGKASYLGMTARSRRNSLLGTRDGH